MDEKRKIIGFVGLPGAGKSTALSIAKEYAPVVVMGDIIREEVIKRKLEPSSEIYGIIAQKLREEEGENVVAQRTLVKINKLQFKNIFVDGIRSYPEVEIFKSKFTFILIAVVAPTELRHQWLVDRNRNDDSPSLKMIQKRDQRELKFGLEKVIDNADYILQNEGTIEDLQEKSRKLIKRVINID